MTEAAGLSVEATGETVGEAKWAALRELEAQNPGLDKSAVTFQVISEGERGILGVGYAPARVVATASAVAMPMAAEDEGEVSALVRELVAHVTAALGIPCRIALEEDDESVRATVTGADLGMLIGRHGHTIDAVQYLASAFVFRSGVRKDVIVDAAGYRARRQATLESLARRSAERALSSSERVELDPMTAVERKVVHTVLQDFPGISTSSEGTEPNRYVVVAPADGD
jgi:spoIIIJ-associated protein